MTIQMGFPFQDYAGRSYSEFFNFYEKNSQSWVGAQSWNTKGYSKLYNIDLSPDSGKKKSDRNQIFVPNVGTYFFTVADSPPRLIREINGKSNSISLNENLKILNSSKKNVFSETEMMITPVDSAIPFKIYMMNVSGKIEDEMLTLNSVKVAILVK